MKGQKTFLTNRVNKQETLAHSRYEMTRVEPFVITLRRKTGLASALRHKTVSGELHKQIKKLQELGAIEMTLPEKPNSRLQKYRLTQKGKNLIAKSTKERM